VNVGVSPFRVLSVCTGGAGLDRGLRRAEPSARTVCYVEVEAFACAVLAAQMDAGALDPAPIWTDARTFDGRAWRGAVDCVVAGFPCQDISSAGKRAGIHGERSGLWFEVARIVRDVGARYVFLENVDALLVRGVDTVLGTLAEMGFAAQWGIFSAAETGAPHLRERWFCLAVAESESGGQRVLRQPSGSGRQPDGPRQAVDDTNTRRRRRRETLYAQGGPALGVQAQMWATPSVPSGGRPPAQEQSETGMLPDGTKRQVDLGWQASRWASPTARDWRAGHANDRDGLLPKQVQVWPTPTKEPIREHRRAEGYSAESGRHTGTTLTDTSVRQPSWQSSRPIAPTCAHGPKCKRVLNPRFVAWLMGWTWVFAQTGFGFLGTASSRNKPSMPISPCAVD
jgi:site-specific DNA-cytosine methylase